MNRSCFFKALSLVVLLAVSAAFAQEEGSPVGLELVAEGFTAPVALIPLPGDDGTMLLVDQIGVVKVIGADGQVQEEPFLDLRDELVELDKDYEERGLLGLAFHPDYAANGRLFVYYSAPLREGAPEGWSSTSHLSEFQVTDGKVNKSSEKVLLQVDEPQLNHNAGQIAFGPDGYLYVPLGDGGGANDEDPGHVDDWYEANDGGNGQDLTTNLLGTILRIDVDSQTADKAYGIPSDNPFVDQAGAEEIYAYGFRNPWRISFDAQTGDLYAADLGQELYEEVNRVEKGGNYGWNVKEGTHCFSTQSPEEPPAECPSTAPDGTPLLDPVLEHDHEVGNAIIGGFIYYGSAFPELDGKYLFGVHATSEETHAGALFAATPGAEGELWSFVQLPVMGNEGGRLGPDRRLLSFGEGADGEVYVLTKDVEGPKGDTGKVYKLTAP
ncbi:PQQ-dependent sugar dehydrogenase [soil metagenome]